MNQKYFTVMAIIAIALAFTACPPPDPVHTHTYSAAWSNDATQHWRECTANDGAKTDVANHTSGDWIVDQAATETTAGSQHKECTVCGYVTETEIIPVHSHTWGNYIETDAPTATADGMQTRTCTTCGATETKAVAGHRETTITFNFTYSDVYYSDVVCSAKVEGTLLLAEWNNVIAQLPQIINNNYTTGTNAVKGRYEIVFSYKWKAVITVEKTDEYANWKTDATGQSLRLNYNTLSNWSSIMNTAVRAMDNYKATQDALWQNGAWVE